MPEDGGAWARPWRSVRVRITLAAAVVAALAMVVAGWLVVRAVSTTQTAKLHADAEKRMDAVARQLRAGEDPQVAVESTKPVYPLVVFNQNGRLVGAAPKVFVGNKLTVQSPPLPDDAAKAGKLAGSGQGTVTAGGQDPGAGEAGGASGRVTSQLVEGEPGGGPAGLRLVAATERLRRVDRKVSTPTGTFTVVSGVPVDEVQRSVDAVRRSMLLGLPGLVALVAALAWMLVGRALRPVEAMRREVEAISESSMHRRVPEPGADDEIGRLALTMNAMLGRLQGAAVRQRQFVSDASHELRSPVAVLRAGLELARGRSDQPAVRDTLDGLLAEEARLEALLDDLLLLAAHEEGGGAPTPAQPVDLASLAAAEAGRHRRVPATLVAPAGGAIVTGTRAQLARVLSNLVDNAARHASSAIEITLASGDGRVRLVVDDDGPGIAAADRARVFERFTRLDDGRARNAGGTGLGLAVVHAIVTGHGGTITVRDSPQGGARFVADLPATGSAPAAQ